MSEGMLAAYCMVPLGNEYSSRVVVNHYSVPSLSTVVTNYLFTFKFNKLRSGKKKMVTFFIAGVVFS